MKKIILAIAILYAILQTVLIVQIYQLHRDETRMYKYLTEQFMKIDAPRSNIFDQAMVLISVTGQYESEIKLYYNLNTFLVMMTLISITVLHKAKSWRSEE